MGDTYNKHNFIEWLKNRGLSKSSISKYSVQANNRIIRDLGIDFYQENSIEALHQLLIDVKNLEKCMEKDPKRMYSSAVANFIKFRVENIDTKNTVNDILYEIEVEKLLVEISRKPELNRIPQPRALLVEKTQFTYSREPKVGADALLLAGYQCQIDNSHQYFKSRKTEKNYVEAHHLIPIAYQGIFENGIDTIENIVSLCPVCHRCIHYGLNEERVPIIQKLHKSFQKELYRVGIEIKENELLDLYNIS